MFLCPPEKQNHPLQLQSSQAIKKQLVTIQIRFYRNYCAKEFQTGATFLQKGQMSDMYHKCVILSHYHVIIWLSDASFRQSKAAYTSKENLTCRVKRCKHEACVYIARDFFFFFHQ